MYIHKLIYTYQPVCSLQPNNYVLHLQVIHRQVVMFSVMLLHYK